MTSNPFSLNSLTPTWAEATEILKGDTPGHPFRGNQYATGEGGGSGAEKTNHVETAQRLSDRAREIHDDAYAYSQGNGIDKFAKEDYAYAHKELAREHGIAAGKAKADNQTDLVRAHLDAEKLHNAAARNFISQRPQGMGERAGRFLQPTQDARQASLAALKEAHAYA